MNIFIIVLTLIVTVSFVYGETLANECGIVGEIIGIPLNENCCGTNNEHIYLNCDTNDEHIINLYFKDVTGPFPDKIQKLTKLQRLGLNGGESGNQFTGEIPDWIGDLEDLTFLDLYGNLLTGSIPDSITKLKNLEEFDISYNCIDCDAERLKYPDVNFQCYEKRTEGCPKNGIEGSETLQYCYAGCVITETNQIVDCTISTEYCENNMYFFIGVDNDENNNIIGKMFKVTDKENNGYVIVNKKGYYTDGIGIFSVDDEGTARSLPRNPSNIPTLNGGDYYLIEKDEIINGDGTYAIVLAKDNAVIEKSIDNKSYLVKIGVANSVFGKKNDYIAVTKPENTIIKNTNTKYLDGEEYCVSDSTKQITEREGNYCDSNLSEVDCDKYYTYNEPEKNFIDTTETFETRDGICDPLSTEDQVYCKHDTYYIKENDGTLLTEHNGKSNNVLLHCTGKKGAVRCDPDDKTIGYVINADFENSRFEYIVCNAKENGENECDAYEIPTDSSCSVGKLNYAESKYKLCIDDNNSVSVSDASYLVDAMSESTFVNQAKVPRVGEYYVIVNIKSGNVILNGQEQKKYKYATIGNNDDYVRRIYNKGLNTSIMCTNTNKLNTDVAKEYILNYNEGDIVDFYKENK